MPVNNLHFNWALLLSLTLFLTVDHIGRHLPTSSTAELAYFSDAFCSISDLHLLSMTLFIDLLKWCFHSNLDGDALKSSNTVLKAPLYS